MILIQNGLPRATLAKAGTQETFSVCVFACFGGDKGAKEEAYKYFISINVCVDDGNVS